MRAACGKPVNWALCSDSKMWGKSQICHDPSHDCSMPQFPYWQNEGGEVVHRTSLVLTFCVSVDFRIKDCKTILLVKSTSCFISIFLKALAGVLKMNRFLFLLFFPPSLPPSILLCFFLPNTCKCHLALQLDGSFVKVGNCRKSFIFASLIASPSRWPQHSLRLTYPVHHSTVGHWSEF